MEEGEEIEHGIRSLQRKNDGVTKRGVEMRQSWRVARVMHFNDNLPPILQASFTRAVHPIDPCIGMSSSAIIRTYNITYMLPCRDDDD